MVPPGKKFAQSAGVPILRTVTQGTPLDGLTVMARGAQSSGPIELFSFAYFKSCCLGVWFPVTLNLGADRDPPFGDTDRSCTVPLLGAIKNKIDCLNNPKSLINNQELG